MGNSVMFVICIYLLSMVGVGLYFNKKNNDNEDYFTGSQSLPGWAIAISERATTSSSWVMLGATGAVYTMGYSGIWLFVGLYSSLLIYWLWYAKVFKRENDKDPAVTLTAFIVKRWGGHAKPIRLICIFIISFFYLFYAASQFVGAGKTVNTLFGYDFVTTIIVVAIVVTGYSSLGGLRSIVWTDVIQGVIMCFALIVLPLIAFYQTAKNGTSVFQEVAAAGPDYASLFGGMTGGVAFLMIFNETSWIWGNFGMPAVTQKIMALKDEKEIKVGRNVGLVWGAVWYLGIFAIGLSGIGLYGPGTFADPETLFPTMVAELLPAWLAALTLCGVVAAIMSTTADQLLAITGAISVDLLQTVLKVRVQEKQIVWISKLTLIGAGAAALFIALKSSSLVMTMVSFAWTGMGASLAPAVLLTLLYKKCSGTGIIATLISGVGFTFIWKYIPIISAVNMRAGAFFLALLVGIVFSGLFPNRAVELEEKNEL